MGAISQAGTAGYLVFVGNIGLQTTETDLESIAKPIGRIRHISLARDQQSGQPLGYGLVKMRRQHEAMRVVAKMNEITLDSRPLIARGIF